MEELEIHCIHRFKYENTGTEIQRTWGYKAFSTYIDNIKKHGVHHLTCLSCGCPLILTVYPGLPFSKAIIKQIRKLKSQRVSPYIFTSFIFFVLALILPIGFRDWIAEGAFGSIANLFLAAYFIAGIIAWGFFLGGIVGDMKLLITMNDNIDESTMPLVPEQGKKGHQIFRGENSVTGTDIDELKLRLMYY